MQQPSIGTTAIGRAEYCNTDPRHRTRTTHPVLIHRTKYQAHVEVHRGNLVKVVSRSKDHYYRPGVTWRVIGPAEFRRYLASGRWECEPRALEALGRMAISYAGPELEIVRALARETAIALAEQSIANARAHDARREDEAPGPGDSRDERKRYDKYRREHPLPKRAKVAA